MVNSLNSLADLYWKMGELAKAEPLFQEALGIRRKVFGPEHPDTAQSLGNLGEMYSTTHEYAKAEPLLLEALRIMRKTLGPEHPYTASRLINLGQLYFFMGEYDQAEPLLQEAIKILRKVLGPEDLDLAKGLTDLAELYHLTDEYAKAEPLYREVLQIRQKVLGPENPDTATALENLAMLDFDLGRMDEATILARQVSAARLTILSKIFSFTSEQQRLAYIEVFPPYSLFPFLEGTDTDLATEVLRYKGVVLDSIVEDRQRAQANRGSEDQKLLEQLNLDKRQVGQLYLQSAQKSTAETNRRIGELEEEIERMESQLGQHVAGQGQARHALGVTMEQVQTAIPNDGALVEYLRYRHYFGKGQWEQRYGAVLLFSQGPPVWIQLGEADEIGKLVQRYGTLVRGSSPEEEELSVNLRDLYERLWGPIEQALIPQTKRIVISPDGQLNFISFATLLDEEEHFVAEKYSVQYVASGRDLVREVNPSSNSQVVLLADPSFDFAPRNALAGLSPDRGREVDDMTDLIFDPLVWTRTETAALSKMFQAWHLPTFSLVGQQATKPALMNIHSPYILHLATHGFFARQDPTSGNKRTGPESLSTGPSLAESKFFKNPMHRSGLALAGANSTIEAWKEGQAQPLEEDGILTAEDVSTLDLQRTWLVTLSACDTGSGEARAGEGVMGLRRGFVRAGAQNLLMTLWPISDEFTPEFMNDFYEAAHRTGNAPGALAEVQRHWLLKLRTERGLAQSVNLAGPFIMSSQGKP